VGGSGVPGGTEIKSHHFQNQESMSEIAIMTIWVAFLHDFLNVFNFSDDQPYGNPAQLVIKVIFIQF
jgi:hypothetical protein